MFTVKRTRHGYRATINFLKYSEDVCAGGPQFYILLTSHNGEFMLDIGIMDDDDIDIYESSVRFNTMNDLVRAFEYACMELYDKRYLASDDLYKTYVDYVRPLHLYLISQI